MAEFFLTTQETDIRVVTQDYSLNTGICGFIASGEEWAFKKLRVAGVLRIDGKVYAGQVVIGGTIKIEGTLETESLFE